MSIDDRIRNTLRESTASLQFDTDTALRDVQHRATRRQTRRQVVGACLAVAAVVLIVAILSPTGGGWLHGDSDDVIRPAPSPHPSTSTEIPPYMNGGKLIASVDRTATQGVTVSFTPTQLNFWIMRGCNGGPQSPKMWVNGRSLGQAPCQGLDFVGPVNDSSHDNSFSDWAADYGVHVGQPVTVRYAYPKHFPVPGTEWRIGVYQAVTPAQYEYPNPPEELRNLRAGYSLSGRRLFTQGPRDSMQSLPTLLYRGPLSHGLWVQVASTEPVGLHLYVNGHPVWTWHSWTWKLESGGSALSLRRLQLQAGAQVNITLRQDDLTSVTGDSPPSTILTLYDRRL